MLQVVDTPNINCMDRFTELLAFVRTVDGGSQAAAAREMSMTPAMVGRYIRALENRLGTRLLNRTTATQSLTDAGAAFHVQAGVILEQLDGAEHAASDGHVEPRGVLRVNAPMVFGVRHLAAVAAGFGARHPQLRIEMVLNDRIVDLVEEGFDVAVRIGDPADSSLVARRLAPCRMAVCAAPGYLAAHSAPARPEDLRDHNCLLYSYARHGSTCRFQGADGAVSVGIAGSLVANNGDALLAAALAGAGVVVQPTFIVGDALRAGSLVRLLPGWEVGSLAVQAIYPSARNLSPKVRGFVDHLARQFGGRPPWDEGL